MADLINHVYYYQAEAGNLLAHLLRSATPLWYRYWCLSVCRDFQQYAIFFGTVKSFRNRSFAT